MSIACKELHWPRLQTKTALSRVSMVAKKKAKGMAKKHDAFLASDTLIKQIPRLNIYEAIIAGRGYHLMVNIFFRYI